jgi:beta-phosphoglucomutase
MVKTTLGPTEHITEAISGLKKQGFAVAVASNCIRSSVKTILWIIDVMKYIDVYVSNEDVPNAKPFPDIYIKACASFCVDPSEALVVEDSTKGFEAASRAGCPMLRVGSPDDVTISALLSRIRELELPSQKITVVVPLASDLKSVLLNCKLYTITSLFSRT